MAKLTFFAAIDIGSSKIGMKIFQLEKNGAVLSIDNCESGLSIGKETYNNGKISYELTGEICNCLEKFKTKMNEYNITEYICYATSAVREASNSEYIRDQIYIRTGLKVGILSNEEERFLHHKALALNMEKFDDIIKDGAVILDVSSGSLQVSSYENSKLKFSQNLPLGSMKFMELMANVNNNTIEFSKLLKEYTGNILDMYGKSFFTDVKYKSVILMSNKMDNIKSIIKTNENDKVSYNELMKIYDEMMDMGLYDFGDKYDINYDNCRQIFSSVLMYIPFLSNEKINIYMPDIDLTDGICVEFAEKNKFTHTKHMFRNDILSSALYYAERYNINKKHTNKIVLYCEEIFKALSKKFGLSKSDLILLKVAAIYADTGLYINVNNYNEYSYTIKRSNMLLGLSNRDNDIISYIILFQNGIFHNEEYKYLSKSRKLQIAKLSAILSLALSLDCEYKQKINEISVLLRSGEIIISAVADADITMEQWQFNENADFFEDVFGIKAKLKKK